jgi:hypothetical protein
MPCTVVASVSDYPGLQLSHYFHLLLFSIHSVDSLGNAVHACALVTNPGYMHGMFQRVIKKLLKASATFDAACVAAAQSNSGSSKKGKKRRHDDDMDDEDSASTGNDKSVAETDNAARTAAFREVHMLLNLVLALIPTVSGDGAILLFKVLQPYILEDGNMDNSGRGGGGAHEKFSIQKRAYKCLESLCQSHPWIGVSTGSGNGQSAPCDVITLLRSSLLTCSASSKRSRLMCLRYIFGALDGTDEAFMESFIVIPEIVGELVLCTKEANGKAREAAMDCLCTIGDRSLEAGKMEELIKIVLGGLAGGSPFARSASIMSLSRLCYEFHRKEDVNKVMKTELLPIIITALKEKAKEVIKSAIGFLKLAVAVLSVYELGPHLEVQLPLFYKFLLR